MIENYKEAFQEEAHDILIELESSLLELNDRPSDMELVGKAFRALHTIKGSGAMFGFDKVSRFAHNLENAFDQVRSGRLAVSPDLISIALGAVDHIKALLGEAAGLQKADIQTGSRVLEKLQILIGTPSAKDAAPAPRPPEKPQTPSEAKSEASNTWRIKFVPNSDLLRTGADPLLLLRELRQLGTLDVKADLSRVPPLAELEPQKCYVGWELTLTTSAGADAIRDVFIFVEDGCELAIEAVQINPQAPEPEAPIIVERRTGRERRSSDKEAQASSIRVAAAKLDDLVDLVGQLVTVQARLGDIAARAEDRDIQCVSEEIESLTAKLRDNSMSMRTMPLRSTFERFKRLVYDLSRSLHKEADLTFEGAETELDKTVIEQLHDPLMHLIRNSMDHGIEAAETRVTAGKASIGNIHLCARHAGAQVLISVTDDGKGIDPAAVLAKAVEKGLVPPDSRLSDAEIFSLVMSPGFSTAQQVTDVSGRGVGMDVVKRNIESLRGSVELASRPGRGTTVTLRLPLTLAIIDGLLVRVGQSRFVMPLANTVECVELTRQEVENSGGKHLANIRGEIIPYIRLSEYLEIATEQLEREQLMVAETEHGRFGFVVDEVLGDHQTVIKNLGRLYRNVTSMSGATILGDGSVALIVDLHRLAQDVLRAS